MKEKWMYEGEGGGKVEVCDRRWKLREKMEI